SERRRGDEEAAAGLEETMDVLEKREWIADMLDHIGDDAKVESAVLERRVFEQAANDFSLGEARVRVFAGGRCQFDAGHVKACRFGFDEEIAVARANLEKPPAMRAAITLDLREVLAGRGALHLARGIAAGVVAGAEKIVGVVDRGE